MLDVFPAVREHPLPRHDHTENGSAVTGSAVHPRQG